MLKVKHYFSSREKIGLSHWFFHTLKLHDGNCLHGNKTTTMASVNSSSVCLPPGVKNRDLDLLMQSKMAGN